VSYRAPPGALADIAGVSSTLLPLRYNIMTSLCGLFVGSSSPRGGARVPFYLVGDVVLRTNHPRGMPFLHPRVEAASPTPTRSRVCQLAHGGLLISRHLSGSVLAYVL